MREVVVRNDATSKLELSLWLMTQILITHGNLHKHHWLLLCNLLKVGILSLSPKLVMAAVINNVLLVQMAKFVNLRISLPWLRRLMLSRSLITL